MPRKEQGWITFQTSEEERQLLEEFCQRSQRTKTEILRELVRGLNQTSGSPEPLSPETVMSAPTADAHSATTTPPVALSPSNRKPLKVSSRNVLQGRVTKIVPGSVNSEITLEIQHPVTLISIITRSSVDELGLVEGAKAYAVIKSSDIVIACE